MLIFAKVKGRQLAEPFPLVFVRCSPIFPGFGQRRPARFFFRLLADDLAYCQLLLGLLHLPRGLFHI